MNLFDRFLGMFSTKLGIDLGTATTLVYAERQGILAAEPSVVAINKKTGEVWNGQAIGDNAKVMIGRAHPNIDVIRPVKGGVINNIEIAEAMIHYFMQKANISRFVKPLLVIAVPVGINTVARQAVKNAGERAGAREVRLVPQPFSAAIGAELPVYEPKGSMIVDIGGGTTDIAVLSLQGIVQSETLHFAGDEFDLAIVRHVLERHGLEIGEQTAERIKLQIGSAYALETEMKMTIQGRDLKTKLPAEVEITSIEIRESLAHGVQEIIGGILKVLGRTPPELSADLVEQGVVLAGGGAMLRGVDRAIEEAIELPVRVCNEPTQAVARGLGVIIEEYEAFGDIVEDVAEAA